MSSPPDLPPAQVVIPEALRLQLDGFRRHLWRVKIMEAAAAGLIGLTVSFLLVYLLDRFIPTPGIVRLLILAAGISLFAVFAPYWLHRWVWRQRRETQLARLISKKYPGLGDRLLGVIELQNQQGAADSLSPRLREAAMEAVAAEAGRRQLDDALPPQRHRRWAMLALILAVAAVAVFTFTPRASQNAFQRWLMPFSKTERYTFTKLENPPRYRAVAFGEAFTIELRLARQSEQRPASASARYGLQPELTADLADRTYRFTFPGQQDTGRVVFRIGDLRHEMKIEPMPRPGIESIHAIVTTPAYLGIPPQTVDLNTGVLNVVEGSKVRLELIANRPLKQATFGPSRPQSLELTADGKSDFIAISGDLENSGTRSSTPSLDIGRIPLEIPFQWTDVLGLAGEPGFEIRIDATSDAPPACYLQGIDRQKAILPEETVEFEVLAEDDFGIKETGIEWTGEFTRPTDEQPAAGSLKLAEGGPEKRRIILPGLFSPTAFNILPQKIILRSYAEDYLPGRPRIYSEPIILYILTRDEHAQMLKNKFDRSISEFEDLARRETELLDENERLERLTGEELQQDKAKKRLQDQEQAESETKRRMDDLTQRMESLMKDAARNGDIEKETLKKMAESLKSMQELSQHDVPKVQEKLGDSQDPANESAKARQDLAEAVEEQTKVVEKMQQAIAKANEAKRQLEAGTFVNRLKKAASDQDGIANSLIEAFDRILGKQAAKIDPSDLRRLSAATNQQVGTASDVRWIQEDLANYYNRTKTAGFKTILDEMKASRIDIELEAIRTFLTANKSFTATEAAKQWADQLNQWAATLAGENEKNSGGGGGGGSPSPEDEDFEFMLRVMKLIQQELDIRSQTRTLEQIRRTDQSPSTAPAQP